MVNSAASNARWYNEFKTKTFSGCSARSGCWLRGRVCEIKEALFPNSGYGTRVAVPVKYLCSERVTNGGFAGFVASNSSALVESLADRPLGDVASFDPTLPHVWRLVVIVHSGAVVQPRHWDGLSVEN